MVRSFVTVNVVNDPCPSYTVSIVTVPVYPVSIRKEFTVLGQPASHVTFLLPLLMTILSPVCGMVPPQFAGVEHKVSVPLPVHVRVDPTSFTLP